MEKVKVVAVQGSPTKDGNTAVLARKVLEGVEDAGGEAEEIFLADHSIEFCRGCISRNIERHCMSTGRCRIPDDVNMLRDKLYDAEGIVFTSPAYGIMETARMKNFIVDRIGMYTAYTSGLGGKYFVGVSTCGGMGGKQVAKSLGLRFVTGFHRRGYMAGALGVTLGNDRIEEKPKDMEKAYLLGKELVASIKEGRIYPFQKLFDRIITKIIVRRVIKKNIYKNKNGSMKAVYEYLVDTGYLSE